jgi:hypothetical protein
MDGWGTEKEIASIVDDVECGLMVSVPLLAIGSSSDTCVILSLRMGRTKP